MNIDDEIKETLNLHTAEVYEPQKMQAHLLGESDCFNRILEMNTEAERRRFAAMAMQAILSNDTQIRQAVSEFPMTDGTHNKYFGIAQCAVAYADALIAELNKKKDE